MSTSAAAGPTNTSPRATYSPLTTFVVVLLLCLPWPYWEGVHLASEIPKSTLIAASACLSALLWLASLTRTGRPVAWHPAWLLVLGFVLWAALSTTWSADPGNALIELTLLISCLWLAFVASQAVTEGHSRLLMAAFRPVHFHQRGRRAQRS